MSGAQDTYCNNAFKLREEQIPLRPDNEYKVISFFGITGSGKTTFLRKIIGINPETENIPPTSSNRTTTHNFEVIVSDIKYYEACITFVSMEYIEDIITECLVKASKEYAIKNDMKKAFSVLFEDGTQSFRLKYIIGDVKKNEKLNKKYSKLIDECSNIYKDLNSILNDGNKIASHDKYENDCIIHDELIADNQFKLIRATIYRDIINTFYRIIRANSVSLLIKDNTSKWPAGCTFKIETRKEFLRKLQSFVGNQKKMWGQLLTPLVESVRISGPFYAQWLNKCPKISFVDGKGIGHTTNNGSIPISYIDLFKVSDIILVIDEASKPMQQSTVDIIKGIVKHGYHEKLLIAFSKFDELKGENYENDDDKVEHITKSFYQVCDNIKEDVNDYLIAEDLEDLPSSKFFYFQNLDKPEDDSNYIKEIEKFIKNIDKSLIIQQQDKNTFLQKNNESSLSLKDKLKKNEIKKSDKIVVKYHEELMKAKSDFQNEWDALLNLPSPTPRQSEHWTRIKALSRRMYYFPESYSYDTLQPVDDFVHYIQSVIYKYVRTLGLDNKHLSSLSSKNIIYAQKWLKKNVEGEWKIAYDRKGSGSTKERSQDIHELFLKSCKGALSAIEKELKKSKLD